MRFHERHRPYKPVYDFLSMCCKHSQIVRQHAETCCFFFVLGPAFNLFLKELNVKLGPFLIDAYTSPGVSLLQLSFPESLTTKDYETIQIKNTQNILLVIDVQMYTLD